MGAGIFAAPPYYCAQGNVEVFMLIRILTFKIALSTCMTDPGSIDVKALIDETNYARALLSIDDPASMANDRVWIFTGELDTVVHQVTRAKSNRHLI